MSSAVLYRVESKPTHTIGILLIDEELFCVTLEDAWSYNIVGNSCIPQGVYVCKRHISPKFGETFEVQDVPNRTNILFHAGNWASDTTGCILLGRSAGALRCRPEERAILNSGDTFKSFMGKMTGKQEFVLLIETM